jgi:peroxiredoxin
MKILYLFIAFLSIITAKANTMDDQNKNAANNANEICPIKIGEEIPSVNLQTIEGKEINIRDLVIGKKSILIFYRGGWCPYCNLHLSELVQIEDSLVKLGYKIIAISMDKPDSLRSTLEKHNMKYELYSDSKADVCTAFGIAFTVDDEYIKKLKSFNMDIEASSGQTHHILPVPGAFIVDANGIIQFEYVNPNYKTRIKGDVLLEVAKRI